MALAIAARFDFIDDKGKTSFTKVRIPSTTTLAAAVDFVEQMAQLIADLSQGILTGASLTFSVDLSGVPGLAATATAISDVFTKGFAQFGATVNGFFSRMKIPTLDEALVPPGGDAVDQADVDVAAFIASMQNGLTVTSGNVSPTDKNGNDLTSVNFFRKLFRKHVGG